MQILEIKNSQCMSKVLFNNEAQFYLGSFLVKASA